VCVCIPLNFKITSVKLDALLVILMSRNATLKYDGTNAIINHACLKFE